MNREQLKELGLTDEQIEAVMPLHGKAVNETKDKLTTAESEVASYKSQLAQRDEDMEGIKAKAGNNEELLAEVETLKESYTAAETEHQKEMNKTKLNYEIDQALILSNAYNPRAVRALLDPELIKFGEDGNVIGLSEQVAGLKETDPNQFKLDEGTPPPSNDFIPGIDKKTNPERKTSGAEAGVAAFDRLKAKGLV